MPQNRRPDPDAPSTPPRGGRPDQRARSAAPGPPLRPRFLERVRKLLPDDEALFPHKIVEVCAAVQRDLMIAPAVDLEYAAVEASAAAITLAT